MEREYCLPRAFPGALGSQIDLLGHHTEPDRVQLLHFYYFTFSANKSRCKQGLFHINILTGFFFFCQINMEFSLNNISSLHGQSRSK